MFLRPAVRRVAPLFITGFLLAAVADPVRAENLVAVRSQVDKDYATKRAAHNPPAPETYVVLKGRYFGGLVQDRSLEKKPFIEIARTVAADLHRQNYVPIRDPRRADLLIVLHWGVTDKVSRYAEFNLVDDAALIAAKQRADDATEAEAAVQDDPQAAYLAAGQRMQEEQTYNNLLSDIVSDLSAATTGGADNARLLGLAGADTGPALFSSEKAATYKAMAEEERYFIIVTAYDFRLLRRTGKPKAVWVARLSARAAGINFHMAVDRLSTAGGDVFGQSTDGLRTQPVSKRKERIEYGDLQVLE